MAVEIFGGEWEPGRRQRNLRAFEPVQEPPGRKLEISQGLEPAFDADRDVAGDEPIELIQTVVERLSLRCDVVLETLRVDPITFLKHDHPDAHLSYRRYPFSRW